MAVIDDTTTARDYPKPHADNALADDVPRVRQALDMIDADVAGLVTSVAGKVDVDSPALTGIPTAPTAVPGTSSGQLATTAFVASAMAALLDSTPATLDTLNELAAALGDDPNFATTMATALAGKLTKTSNLSDLANIQTAVNNLLGGAQGDILYRGASGWSKLAKGNSGQTFRQNEAKTAPVWANGWSPLPGGEINITSVTGYAEVVVPSDTEIVRITGDFVPNIDNNSLQMRVALGGIINSTPGAYAWQYNHANAGSITGNNDGGTGTSFILSVTAGNANQEGCGFCCTLQSVNKGRYKMLTCVTALRNAAGEITVTTIGGQFLSTGILTHLRLFSGAGDIALLRAKVEGWRA